MTAFDHSTFLQALGWAVLNSLWQMALLWIVFNTIISLSGSDRPAQKSRIAASLLFTGFAWFVFTFVSLLISRENNNAIISVTALPVGVNQQVNQWLDACLPVASVIYIGLLTIPLLQFIRNYRYVQVLRKFNLSKIDIDWRIFVKKIAAQIGITKSVRIWVSDLITSPVTIGYLKPIILVPMAAINHLTPDQMEAVLLHELSHIRRYDYLINLLINFVQTILYFNPFVKSFVKTIERERESSCDEMVIQFQYDPHHYASALLMLERNNIVAQNMAIAASGKSDLLTRIERILHLEKKHVFSFNRLAGLFAGLLFVIILNAVLIVGKPATRSSSFFFEQPGSPATLFTLDEENQSRPDSASNAVKKTVSISPDRISPAIWNAHTGTPVARVEPTVIKQTAFLSNDPVRYAEEPAAIATNVGFKTVLIPTLTKGELRQVQTAVSTTRKIIQDAQWKEVEKSIADVLTTMEKEEVREKYLQELSKVNWDKLETKLKISYDQLNWSKINAKLNTAITNIKLDSLQLVFTILNNTLSKAEKAATSTDTASVNVEVPLPDVSVECIKQSKEQVMKSLNKIKAIRNRKVIHL